MPSDRVKLARCHFIRRYLEAGNVVRPIYQPEYRGELRTQHQERERERAERSPKVPRKFIIPALVAIKVHPEKRRKNISARQRRAYTPPDFYL